MEILILILFLLGYTAITIEHTIKIDKLIPALLMMAISWTIISLNLDAITQWLMPHTGTLQAIVDTTHEQRLGLLETTLLHHFGKTAEILIFLIGAMIIVELIDYFDGFSVIKKMIRTKSKLRLLWIISVLAFVLSAVIDNLTATIVLITILRKIIIEPTERLWYAGFIVIAANAGGACSPIGDVTTTMLWMAGKVSAGKLVSLLIIPSAINLLIPLIVASFLPAFKGTFTALEEEPIPSKQSAMILYLGLGLVIFVPIFKTLTHLPPYLGMMLSLSLFALVAELSSKRIISFSSIGDENHFQATKSPTINALGNIELTSVLFFLGILMTVASMESLGMIFNAGQYINSHINETVFVSLLGLGSAIIDNVPLVAASLGMFSDPHDANVWHFLAYTAGTGGSLLIIGSAAGVIAMSMEKITFFWYLTRIAPLAILGYFAGIIAFLLLTM